MFFCLLLLFCQAEQIKDEKSSKTISKTSSNYQNIINIKEDSEIPIPISIPLAQTKITGAKNCETAQCPADSIATEPCGERCWVSQGNKDTTFEYTFKGVKVQIYGTNDPNHGSYDVYIDDVFITSVDQHVETRATYQLQFTSDLLPYGEHTIKAAGKGQTYELYKFAYWPSLETKRINISDLDKVGNWQTESDGIGGVRQYINSANGKATAPIKTTKFWVYGTKCSWHGSMTVKFGSHEGSIDEHITGDRQNSVLVYESPDLPLTSDTLTFTSGGTVTIDCIYYVDEPDIVAISVPLAQTKITGAKSCETAQCPSNSIATEPCGERCWVSQGNKDTTFEYTFKGVRAQIFGTNDPNHGSYDVYIDDVFITSVDQHVETRATYQLQFTSDLLPYGEHTIKAAGKGQTYELYKFAYWPLRKAKRINISDLDKDGNWQTESDGIGGVRQYINGANGKAMVHLEATKFWVYGTKCSWHGSMTVKFGSHEGSIDEHITGDRQNSVLVYESPDLPLTSDTLTFTSGGTVTIDCIYYVDEPLPTPSPLPTQSPMATPSQSPMATPTQSPMATPSQSPMATPSQSPMATPTQSPMATPTQSPMATPSQSPMATPTEAPPPPTIIEKENCDNDGRYEKVVDDLQPVMVSIKVSSFQNITHDDIGGAIHIENSGIECDNILFENCESREAGGAVYVNNTYSHLNLIDFEHINFIDCSAKYGGAVYVYSSSSKNTVRIKHCTFIGNTATSTQTDENKKFGGSAIFLTARKGDIRNNKFRDNDGDGGAVKIYNIFENNEVKNLRLLNNEKEVEESLLSISDCAFEINQNSDCCLYYVRGENGASIKLQKCSFSGSLSKGSHYINGESISKIGPKLVIQKCRFSYDSSRSLKIDKNNDYLSIDLKGQIFDRSTSMKKQSKVSTMVIVDAVCASVVVIAAIVGLIVFSLERRNPNEAEENEMSTEVRNLLLYESSLQNNDSVNLPLN